MLKIPYGESNFEKIIEYGFHYVDRTQFLVDIEDAGGQYLFFLRPRRFGKSLFISILQYYYGLRYKSDFERNFGQLYIGKNPTPFANHYFILKYDFSGIDTDTIEGSYQGFLEEVKTGVRMMFNDHPEIFSAADLNAITQCDRPEVVIRRMTEIVRDKGADRSIYLLIDEYDHFTNRLLVYNKDAFQRIVSQEGFYRSFFEAIKVATQQRVVERMFTTGVSPITLDSLTSGFNIGTNITLDARFHNMLGFRAEEVAAILAGCGVKTADLPNVLEDVRRWYDGYRFHKNAELYLYNPDMVLYFAQQYKVTGQAPEQMLDVNIASDYGRLRRMFHFGNYENNVKLLETLVEKKTVQVPLTIQFSTDKDWTSADFISFLFYNGLVTIEGAALGGLSFKVPNEVIHELYFQFFRTVVIEKAHLSEYQVDMWPSLTQLANHNNPRPFLEMVGKVLEGLDNRDYQQFGEKHLKSIAAALFFPLNTYHVRSEFPVGSGYVDLMLLHRTPIEVPLQFAFELKYVKKSEPQKVEKVLAEGIDQMKRYLQHPDIRHVVGTRIPLKGWVVVFLGPTMVALQAVES